MRPQLRLNDRGYFEKRGLNILAFSNWYDGNFSDAKISGVELIHGTPDDRWAFTSRSTPLNYGSAAASRALRGYHDELADECLATAKEYV